MQIYKKYRLILESGEKGMEEQIEKVYRNDTNNMERRLPEGI